MKEGIRPRFFLLTEEMMTVEAYSSQMFPKARTFQQSISIKQVLGTL